MMTLAQALGWLPGARLVGAAGTPVSRVHSDTRTLQQGDLFVALRGERFDANDLLADARARGAAAALAERGLAAAGLPGLEVADSRQALAQLAAGWRTQFTLPLIAVTGSNGKTTVTQMIAAILRAWRGDAALATQGNFNNDIGLPLTLLRLRAEHRVAVLELGMNHPGEIARLAALAQPTVALVNNAQREHQEFMASVAAVARENGAVLEALPSHGVAVLPADDAHAPLWRDLAGARRCITFGDGAAHAAADGAPTGPVNRASGAHSADVLGDAHWDGAAWQARARTPAGEIAYRLAAPGRHNLRNSLAAAAAALAAGAPQDAVQRGLQAFEPVAGRSRALQLCLQGRAITLVDDSYNANPDSVRAAIDLLATLPAPQLLVLGDMGEVGADGPRFHAEVGAHAAARGVDALWCAGAQCAETARAFGAGRHFASVEALLAALPGAAAGFASVLVKGSRFMRMERVVQALARQAEPAQEASHAA